MKIGVIEYENESHWLEQAEAVKEVLRRDLVSYVIICPHIGISNEKEMMKTIQESLKEYEDRYVIDDNSLQIRRLCLTPELLKKHVSDYSFTDSLVAIRVKDKLQNLFLPIMSKYEFEKMVEDASYCRSMAWLSCKFLIYLKPGEDVECDFLGHELVYI